jgi:hypothetical protein
VRASSKSSGGFSTRAVVGLVTTLLAVVSTAVPAAAAPNSASAQATCRYEVNHHGGIYIYKVNAVGAYWGSLANGATFSAACNNGEGEPYSDCVGGTARLWKAVNAGGGRTGYVKTKCLVRL